MKPFFDALYTAGVEIVLSGHEHVYERFAPQQADGTADPARGVREFVVGTGGAELLSNRTAASQQRIPKQHDLGRPAADARPGELQLAVHAGRGRRRDRLRHRDLPSVSRLSVKGLLLPVESGVRGDAVLHGPDGGLHAAREVELAQDVLDVDLDGALGDVEVARDLLVAGAAGEDAAGSRARAGSSAGCRRASRRRALRASACRSSPATSPIRRRRRGARTRRGNRSSMFLSR